jgi:hypothetical protein
MKVPQGNAVGSNYRDVRLMGGIFHNRACLIFFGGHHSPFLSLISRAENAPTSFPFPFSPSATQATQEIVSPSQAHTVRASDFHVDS